jgi:hypothetical protein
MKVEKDRIVRIPFDEPLAPSAFDKPEFLDYRSRIEALMTESGDRGISTADVHRAFGHELQHWTADALEQLDTEEASIHPVRYRLRTWWARAVHKPISLPKPLREPAQRPTYYFETIQ